MEFILAIPRLFRLPNLLIVFLTQWIPYWIVLRPAILKSGAIPVLTEESFTLITLNTVLITLGGYLINDYFDKDIDAVNDPDRVIAGRLIPAVFFLYFYWLILFATTLLSIRIYNLLPGPGMYWPLWVFPLVSGCLFLYAAFLKCTPLMGNLVVAILCAVVPVILLIPEDRPIWLGSFRDPGEIHQAVGLVWLYALFAFITNLWREQVKDLEDFPGDAACKCATLPVVKGPRAARVPAGFTGLFASIMTLFLILFWSETLAPSWQIIAGYLLLLLPSLVAAAFVFFAKARKHHTVASVLIKVVMISGLFLLVRSWPSHFDLSSIHL
jgi:4-hydroxybenzoate polyprenyltransferase